MSVWALLFNALNAVLLYFNLVFNKRFLFLLYELYME